MYTKYFANNYKYQHQKYNSTWAQKRIDQEQVFGSKINVGQPVIVQPSPSRNQRQNGNGGMSGRRHYNSEGEYNNCGGNGGSDFYNGYNNGQENNIQDPTSNFQLWHSNNKSSFQNYQQHRPILGISRGDNSNSLTNGNTGHNYCSSSSSNNNTSNYYKNNNHTTGNMAFPMNNHHNGNNSQNQPITILKRSSPLPSTDLSVFSINTSIPPPPIVNLPRANNSSSNLCSSMNERYFHPIPSSSSSTMNTSINANTSFNSTNMSTSTNNNGGGGGSSTCPPVELHVTNLDQTIDSNELKHLLRNYFSEHVKVIHVSVFVQSDGTQAASVKLKSLQDAQYAISQLHRKKIGIKRIMISYAHSNTAHSPVLIRSQIISLLQEVPTCKLPLFKFREMFEMRYSTSISVSELYKMKDVCNITEENHGRTITLNPDHQISTTPSPVNRQNCSTPLPEQPYCSLHYKLGGKHLNSSTTSTSSDDKGWAELEASVLPNVNISLKIFSQQVLSMIEAHNGVLPLLSFVDCYENQFGSLPVDECGVALEHLVTCIKGVELATNVYAGIKFLKKGDGSMITTYNEDGASNDVSPCVSPSLHNQITLLCRELVDLIKTFPHCQMLFNKFIPAYHHHFGRQCRVADYGFTKLIDLLEAIPHYVQVIGDGSRRLITLSHRAQMRRFTSDILRTLKSVPNKQCTISLFPTEFERVHSRKFDPVDYGLTSLEDLLMNMSENTIVAQPCTDSNDTIIAVPKREQTPEEIERTKKFSREVVEVLSHMPHYSILFNKFIPSYHHHYGHQCRVSDFGFTKLIELFESIPEVVTIEDDIDDRRISLTIKEKMGVLLEQIKSLITIRSPITLDNLNASFSWQYGYTLRPMCYNCENLEELIKKLEPNIKIDNRKLIIHEDNLIGLKIFRIFLENNNTTKILLNDFYNIYKKIYKQIITYDELNNNTETIKLIKKLNTNNIFVQLTSLQLFAKDVYHLLYNYDGKISLNNFESMYLKMYGTAVQCALYNHQSLTSLLESISHIVCIKGRNKQKILMLNRSLSNVGIALPRENNNNNNVNQVNGTNGRQSYFKNNNNNNNDYSNKYRSNSDDNQCYTNNQAHLQQRFRKNSESYSNFDNVMSSHNNNNQKCVNNNNNNNGPLVTMPDFKIHPNTFTCTPLTSPYKGLPPPTAIVPPHPSELPLPPFSLNLN